MSRCASFETEVAVDDAVLLCRALFQTKTLPLLVQDFTSVTYNYSQNINNHRTFWILLLDFVS